MLGKVSRPEAVGVDARAGRRPGKGGMFPGMRPAAAVSRLSMVGMALGYVGLVVMLSTAPYWHQVMGPHQGQHAAACTDFGGSR
jgi:hypothetical protein